MKAYSIFLVINFFLAFSLQAKDQALSVDLERGRYLVKTTGCNDCHTPMYGMKNGEVPEKDWLIGDGVGWKGPWGTSYPSNLRARIQTMKEEEFVQYAKAFKTRPPMPWYSVNAMTTADLRSLYRFVKSLGPSSNQVPAALPPGETPKGPYMDMTVLNF